MYANSHLFESKWARGLVTCLMGLVVLAAAAPAVPVYATAPADLRFVAEDSVQSHITPALYQDWDDDGWDNYNNQPSDEEAMAAVFAVLCIYGFIFLVAIGIQIVILALIASCYSRIPRQYRVMEPGMVWLSLIPLFNIVWNFFVVLRLSESFQNYFNAHGPREPGDYGKTLGLWGMIIGFVPCAGIASPIIMIVWLIKMWGYRSMIPAGAMSSR